MDSEIKCVYPRRVAADMVAPLPLVKYEGEIELVEDGQQLDRALAEISRESVLGFDTETRPNFNRGQGPSGFHIAARGRGKSVGHKA